jgi:hypothetical protein
MNIRWSYSERLIAPKLEPTQRSKERKERNQQGMSMNEEKSNEAMCEKVQTTGCITKRREARVVVHGLIYQYGSEPMERRNRY